MMVSSASDRLLWLCSMYYCNYIDYEIMQAKAMKYKLRWYLLLYIYICLVVFVLIIMIIIKIEELFVKYIMHD